jgi:formylglycine-generating enzyme required for sulfatase activity
MDSAITCNFSANGYRLLTEAEWEYAARGGHLSEIDYLYAGSNSADEVAWTSNNSSGETQDVGQLKPNELGLYDMSGNVSEWCWDWFAAYQAEAIESPRGPATGTERVERGGNWRFSEIICPNTRRHFVPPSNNYHRLGFRIGRSK